MKLGITTQTFINCIFKKEIDEIDVINFAKNSGFNWVEIRNKNFHIAQMMLKRIKSAAEERNIKVHYAWDGGSLFDDNYDELFKKHIKIASMFGKNVISRVTIDTSKINSQPNKIGYTQCEFDIIVKRMNHVIEIASLNHVSLAFENAFEPLCGKPGEYYGFTELLKHCRAMKMTLDTANFLNSAQQKELPSQNDVKELFSRFCTQIPYIHIKSTKNNLLENVITANGDFNWLPILQEDKWYCIELPAQDNFERCKQMVLDSKYVIATMQQHKN